MNTSEVAERLGTEPKILRRFLRGDPTYTNAANTAAGRYNFQESDIPTLTRLFTAWMLKNAGRKRSTDGTVKSGTPRRRSNPNGDPGLPVEMLGRKLTRSERARRDEQSRARVDRLEAKLRAAGNHLSQIKDRDDWAVV